MVCVYNKYGDTTLLLTIVDIGRRSRQAKYYLLYEIFYLLSFTDGAEDVADRLNSFQNSQ